MVASEQSDQEGDHSRGEQRVGYPDIQHTGADDVPPSQQHQAVERIVPWLPKDAEQRGPDSGRGACQVAECVASLQNPR